MPNRENHEAGKKRAPRLTPQTLQIREKQAAAARLFGEGVPLGEIAARLGYANSGGAHKAIKAVLNRADSAAAETIRAAHQLRLGASYQAAFAVLNRQYPAPVVPAGMDAAEGAKWVDRVASMIEERAELQLKAIDRLVRIMEREARLHGLDAPTRNLLAGEGGEPITVSFHSALMPETYRTPAAPRRYEVES